MANYAVVAVASISHISARHPCLSREAHRIALNDQVDKIPEPEMGCRFRAKFIFSALACGGLLHVHTTRRARIGHVMMPCWTSVTDCVSGYVSKYR
jgi:hypothetical protein